MNQNFLVSANSVKEAYERIVESLDTLMVDFEIPSIIVSPIVEIFPYNEDLDREIERRPIEEVEELVESSGSPVFSASGSAEEDEEQEEVVESEVEDEYDEEVE